MAADTTKKHFIRIRGANVNNLKNLSVDIPRDKFVVFTGLSGSGKSSLAFDTIYAESGFEPTVFTGKADYIAYLREQFAVLCDMEGKILAKLAAIR